MSRHEPAGSRSWPGLWRRRARAESLPPPTADLTVFTSGANAQQIEMPNVVGVGAKMNLINTMLQELEVTKGS